MVTTTVKPDSKRNVKSTPGRSGVSQEDIQYSELIHVQSTLGDISEELELVRAHPFEDSGRQKERIKKIESAKNIFEKKLEKLYPLYLAHEEECLKQGVVESKVTEENTLENESILDFIKNSVSYPSYTNNVSFLWGHFGHAKPQDFLQYPLYRNEGQGAILTSGLWDWFDPTENEILFHGDCYSQPQTWWPDPPASKAVIGVYRILIPAQNYYSLLTAWTEARFNLEYFTKQYENDSGSCRLNFVTALQQQAAGFPGFNRYYFHPGDTLTNSSNNYYRLWKPFKFAFPVLPGRESAIYIGLSMNLSARGNRVRARGNFELRIHWSWEQFTDGNKGLIFAHFPHPGAS